MWVLAKVQLWLAVGVHTITYKEREILLVQASTATLAQKSFHQMLKFDLNSLRRYDLEQPTCTIVDELMYNPAPPDPAMPRLASYLPSDHHYAWSMHGILEIMGPGSLLDLPHFTKNDFIFAQISSVYQAHQQKIQETDSHFQSFARQTLHWHDLSDIISVINFSTTVG